MDVKGRSRFGLVGKFFRGTKLQFVEGRVFKPRLVSIGHERLGAFQDELRRGQVGAKEGAVGGTFVMKMAMFPRKMVSLVVMLVSEDEGDKESEEEQREWTREGHVCLGPCCARVKECDVKRRVQSNWSSLKSQGAG